MISILVDAALHRQATEVLCRLGITPDMAVTLLFRHLAERGTLPDALKMPNAATRNALAEADSIFDDRRRSTA